MWAGSEVSQQRPIAGMQLRYAAREVINHPDILTIKGNPGRLYANWESSQNQAITRSQFCDVVAVLVSDPDIGAVKSHRGRPVAYCEVRICFGQLVPTQSGNQRRIEAVVTRWSCWSLGPRITLVALVTLRSLRPHWSGRTRWPS